MKKAIIREWLIWFIFGSVILQEKLTVAWDVNMEEATIKSEPVWADCGKRDRICHVLSTDFGCRSFQEDSTSI